MGKLGQYLKEKLSYFDLNKRAEKGEDAAHKKTLEQINEIGVSLLTYRMVHNALRGIYDMPDEESEQLLKLAKAVALVTINNGSESEKSLRENELVEYGRLLRERHVKEVGK